MPNLRLALIVSAVWLTACVLTGGLAVMLGQGSVWLGVAVLLPVLTVLLTLIIAVLADQREARKLTALALAAGLSETPGETMSMGAIVTRLGRRIERAQHFKNAVSVMQHPLVIADDQGVIVAVSAGIAPLVQSALEGASLDALFGEGYSTAGGGPPEQSMVMLDDRRFEVRRRSIAANRYLLEFVPAGTFIEDDDLDAFAGALASGHTSFRFETQATARNEALLALNGAMAAIDAGLNQLDRVAAGHDELHDALDGPLSGVARRLNDFAGAVLDQVAEEQELRKKLEARLGAIGALVQGFEARIAQVGAQSAANQDDAASTGRALALGTAWLKQTLAQGRDAKNLAGAAEMAVRRTHAVAGEVDQMTREVDQMVQSIEDVSFRTNLLALNAAVEAARAGEKGAGFAVVADEVRQLAQLTNRSAREIRAVVSRGRAQAETGLAEAQSLQKMIGELDAYLRNLSNDSDTIAAALDEGELAMRRLAERMALLGEAAQPASRPERRASA
jgi:methyl-accepting chemotaxis protein